MALPGFGSYNPDGSNESHLASPEPKSVAVAVRRGAHRERRVNCAAKGLSSFRNHHDVKPGC